MRNPARNAQRHTDHTQEGRIDYPLSRLRELIRSGKYPFKKLSVHRRLRLINSAIVSREAAGDRNGRPFPLHENKFVSATEYFSALEMNFRTKISTAATNDLRESDPDSSAFRLLNWRQWAILLAMLICGVAGAAASPIHTAIALNIFATAYFVSAILYRAFLLAVGPGRPTRRAPSLSSTAPDLPVITILLPLYKDASSLPSLVESIDALTYPDDKKDIIFLLEADDRETCAEARRLKIDQRYNVLIIPDGHPRTKPKACNFGMHMARGDLIVIYDAEDQPETDQLLCAAEAFAQSDASVACVQAKLNYDNRNDNWLTRGIMAQVAEITSLAVR